MLLKVFSKLKNSNSSFTGVFPEGQLHMCVLQHEQSLADQPAAEGERRQEKVNREINYSVRGSRFIYYSSFILFFVQVTLFNAGLLGWTEKILLKIHYFNFYTIILFRKIDKICCSS